VRGPGLYEISGLAWSGYGKVAKVEVSADGVKSWGLGAPQQPVLSKVQRIRDEATRQRIGRGGRSWRRQAV
jgi:Mo-co oxidoreductase dimerisation domain